MAYYISFKNVCTLFRSGYTSLHSHSRAEGLPFLHILTSICYPLAFDDSHSDSVVISPYSSSFPLGLVMLRTFSCTCWPFEYHRWKNICSVLCSFFNWIICGFFVFAIDLYEFLYVLDINPYSNRWFTNIIFAFCRLNVLMCKKLFSLM